MSGKSTERKRKYINVLSNEDRSKVIQQLLDQAGIPLASPISARHWQNLLACRHRLRARGIPRGADYRETLFLKGVSE